MSAELFDFPDHEPPEPEEIHGRLHTADGLAARLDGYRPVFVDVDTPLQDAPAPAVLWLHGGGWRWGTGKHTLNPLPTRRIRDELLRRGIAFASVEYRLSAEARWPAQLHDAKAAIRWLRRYAGPLRIDPTRIGAWGESAGATLAVLLAATGGRSDLEGDTGVAGLSSSISACVDWYGPADLTARPAPPLIAAFTGDDPILARQASPLYQITATTAPTLIIHGQADTVVAADDSTRLARAYGQAGAHAELRILPGAGHALAGTDPANPIRRSILFLARHLASD